MFLPFCSKILAKRRTLVLDEDWEEELNEANTYCTSIADNPSQQHRMRSDGYYMLKRIGQGLESARLLRLNDQLLIWSALGLLSHYRARREQKGICECIRRKEYDQVTALTSAIISKLIPTKQHRVIEHSITYITHNGLWSKDYLALNILRKPLHLGVPVHLILNFALDRVETIVKESSMEGREVFRIIYELMSEHKWPPQNQDGLCSIVRLFNLYYLAIREESGGFASLRKGLELSTIRVLEHLVQFDVIVLLPIMIQWIFDPKLTDDAILDIGNVIEHTAMMQPKGIYNQTFSVDLFTGLMQMVGSKRRLISHIGNRTLHQILDRHDNRYQFETPKIFFQDTHFNIQIGDCKSQDRVFLKTHRRLFHDAILKSIICHAHHRINLESIYTTICIMICEIPCGFTAAAIACLMMNIQEVIRHERLDLPSEVKYHTHAIIVAVMSLICWIFKAEELYDYVNKIMTSRANEAPHLNPPLRNHYTFALHHVLWDKPEFFFEDWEIRFGLWKCFKTKDTRRESSELDKIESLEQELDD